MQQNIEPIQHECVKIQQELELERQGHHNTWLSLQAVKAQLGQAMITEELLQGSRLLRWHYLFCRKRRQEGWRGVAKAVMRRMVPAHLRKKIKLSFYNIRNAFSKGQPVAVMFPIIPWDFRWQRPQHLAVGLVKSGFKLLKLSCGTQVRSVPECPPLEAISMETTRVWLGTSSFWNHYAEELAGANLDFAVAEMSELFITHGIKKPVYIVQFPTWRPLAQALKEKFGGDIVFDCMDEHSGFSNTTNIVVEEEERLIQSADLVLASSDYLYAKCAAKNQSTIIVRNGTEFEHFHAAHRGGWLDYLGDKPIIGYYGAIAEWFDMALVRETALAHPEWNLVLIGAHLPEYKVEVQTLPNIHFLGERPYRDLPAYLGYFDVCLIPFKLVPLIMATNPVKFYEYLSCGKPVVSVNLPELRPYADLCYLAEKRENFIMMVEKALAETPSLELLTKRQNFAKENSWSARVKTLQEQPLFKKRLGSAR